jgi:hypothetical protein
VLLPTTESGHDSAFVAQADSSGGGGCGGHGEGGEVGEVGDGGGGRAGETRVVADGAIALLAFVCFAFGTTAQGNAGSALAPVGVALAIFASSIASVAWKSATAALSSECNDDNSAASNSRTNARSAGAALSFRRTNQIMPVANVTTRRAGVSTVLTTEECWKVGRRWSLPYLGSAKTRRNLEKDLSSGGESSGGDQDADGLPPDMSPSQHGQGAPSHWEVLARRVAPSSARNRGHRNFSARPLPQRPQVHLKVALLAVEGSSGYSLKNWKLSSSASLANASLAAVARALRGCWHCDYTGQHTLASDAAATILPHPLLPHLVSLTAFATQRFIHASKPDGRRLEKCICLVPPLTLCIGTGAGPCVASTEAGTRKPTRTRTWASDSEDEEYWLQRQKLNGLLVAFFHEQPLLFSHSCSLQKSGDQVHCEMLMQLANQSVGQSNEADAADEAARATSGFASISPSPPPMEKKYVSRAAKGRPLRHLLEKLYDWGKITVKSPFQVRVIFAVSLACFMLAAACFIAASIVGT